MGANDASGQGLQSALKNMHQNKFWVNFKLWVKNLFSNFLFSRYAYVSHIQSTNNFIVSCTSLIEHLEGWSDKNENWLILSFDWEDMRVVADRCAVLCIDHLCCRSHHDKHNSPFCKVLHTVENISVSSSNRSSSCNVCAAVSHPAYTSFSFLSIP